jgi:hypothetical protein
MTKQSMRMTLKLRNPLSFLVAKKIGLRLKAWQTVLVNDLVLED